MPYLALGDSVPYGWDIVTQPLTAPPEDHVGYPETLGMRSPLVTTNAACPGETSASFLDAAARDNGCDLVASLAGLKVDRGDMTQVRFAEDFLAANPDTGLVSIQLGANDLFLCQEGDDDDGDGETECTPQEFAEVLRGVATNLTISLTRIRATGYDGPVALVAYYALDYGDPVQTAVALAFRDVLRGIADSGAFGDVVVADGYAAFEQASRSADGDPCAAGLLLQQPTDCNIHPSPSGDRVLAQALHRAIGLGDIVSETRSEG